MHAVNLELVPVSGSCRTIQMKRFNLNQLAIIALIFSASAFAAQPKSGTAPAPAATSAPVQKLVRIATLNGVEANREFQANVQLLQAQRQTAVELNTAMEKERDARKKAELKTQLAADPNEVPRLRVQQLNAELSRLNSQFSQLEKSLVPPEQMAPLLEQVLRRTGGVSVAQVQTLVPQALPEREAAEKTAGPATASAGGAASARAGGEAGQPALYRHGVELTLRGSYADLLQYVSNVERLPVRVYFGRAMLDAAKYPEVELRLTVYTLGIDKSWLAL